MQKKLFYAENIKICVCLSNAPHPSLYTAAGAMGECVALSLILSP